MTPRFRTLVGLKTIAVLATLTIPTLVAAELRDSPPPVEVFVDGRAHFVSETMTFGQAIKAFRVHAHAGRLLDVEGRGIPGHARPGRVLLDGEEAPLRTEPQERERSSA